MSVMEVLNGPHQEEDTDCSKRREEHVRGAIHRPGPRALEHHLEWGRVLAVGGTNVNEEVRAGTRSGHMGHCYSLNKHLWTSLHWVE